MHKPIGQSWTAQRKWQSPIGAELGPDQLSHSDGWQAKGLRQAVLKWTWAIVGSERDRQCIPETRQMTGARNLHIWKMKFRTKQESTLGGSVINSQRPSRFFTSSHQEVLVGALVSRQGRSAEVKRKGKMRVCLKYCTCQIYLTNPLFGCIWLFPFFLPFLNFIFQLQLTFDVVLYEFQVYSIAVKQLYNWPSDLPVVPVPTWHRT